MEQLPKIARERLQASRAGEHPDPDLLTSFVEQSLTESERSQVLEHLSRCRECRGVIAVVCPEPVTTGGPAEAQPVRPTANWLRWPVLRWGALAAFVVVVSAMALLYRERFSHPRMQPVIDERSLIASDVPKQAEAEEPAALSGKETPQTRTGRGDNLRAIAPRTKAPTPSTHANEAQNLYNLAGSAPAAPPAVQIPAPADRLALSAENKALAPRPSEKLQAAPPAADQGVPAAGVAAAAKPALSDMAAKDERTKSDQVAAELVAVTPEMPAQEVKSAKRKNNEEGNQKLAKQVDSDVTGTQAAFASERLASTAASTNAPGLLRDLKSTRWSLSDDGLPQRSFNGGNTWEKVQVDHTTGFRALSAQGFDVWVGGRSGLLYHSADLGLHWTRVTPMVEGAALTADILRIEFSDSLHGKLTITETPTLVTSDGGKSWQKQ